MIRAELPGLFDGAWCARVTAWLDARGFTRADRDYPTSYRTNERWVGDEPLLAAEVFARLGPHLPTELTDAAGARWRLVGLDERLRACRYGPGQWFGPHRDGVFWRSARERSFLSVLVYLDTAFEGGDTRFFADRTASVVTSRITPELGKAAFFEHTLWHDGAEVLSGTKHVLRTDVVYRCESAAQEGHRGYVWALAPLGDMVASGGRDRTLRLWRDGALAAVREGAHDASVTCLASVDARSIVSGSRDRTVASWRWDGHTLEEMWREESHHGAVLAVAARDATIASAGADGAIVLRDASGRLVVRADLHEGWAWGVALLGGDRCVSVGDDARVVLSERGRTIAARTLSSPLRAVCTLGDRVAVGALDGSIALLRPADLTIERAWSAHEGAVTTLAALPGGSLASGGEDDRARVWTAAGDLIGERIHGDFVRAVCPSGDRLASAGYDGAVRVEAI